MQLLYLFLPLTVQILFISASWSTLHSSPQLLCFWFRLCLYQICLPYKNVAFFWASSKGHLSQQAQERFRANYHCHYFQPCSFHVAFSAFTVVFFFANIKRKPPSQRSAIYLIFILAFLFISNSFRFFISFLILLGWYVNPLSLMMSCWV